jgi:hypothetical protein
MNMVEIWFSILTSQQVRRGVYHDVPELIAAIDFYIEHYNQRAQPFVWTKTADTILAKAVKTTTHFRNAALERSEAQSHPFGALLHGCGAPRCARNPQT